ncbi:aminoacyl-tRNA hydrolase [archaeon]|nr:MAG: aminoacyl-tRNA hydrolase [archaeon]
MLYRLCCVQGGQNVNKVETKADVRFHVDDAKWLDDHTKQRLKSMYAGSMNKEGELIVTSQRHRTQESNLSDALGKLHDMVLAAAAIPAERHLKTDLSEETKRNYRDDKRRRSDVKARRRGSWDD